MNSQVNRDRIVADRASDSLDPLDVDKRILVHYTVVNCVVNKGASAKGASASGPRNNSHPGAANTHMGVADTRIGVSYTGFNTLMGVSNRGRIPPR